MKKVIAFFKNLFSTPVEPVVTPTPVVVEEVKKETPKVKKVVVSEPEAAPKKKKRYYKPKNKA